MEFIYKYLVVVNIFTFCIFGLDKLLAILNKRRISEKLFMSLSILGGCYLELLGMFIFRHKIRKVYFYIMNIGFL